MRNETSTAVCGWSRRGTAGDHLGHERRRRVPRHRELIDAGGVRVGLRLVRVAATVAIEVETDQRLLDGAVDDPSRDGLLLRPAAARSRSRRCRRPRRSTPAPASSTGSPGSSCSGGSERRSARCCTGGRAAPYPPRSAPAASASDHREHLALEHPVGIALDDCAFRKRRACRSASSWARTPARSRSGRRWPLRRRRVRTRRTTRRCGSSRGTRRRRARRFPAATRSRSSGRSRRDSTRRRSTKRDGKARCQPARRDEQEADGVRMTPPSLLGRCVAGRRKARAAAVVLALLGAP